MTSIGYSKKKKQHTISQIKKANDANIYKLSSECRHEKFKRNKEKLAIRMKDIYYLVEMKGHLSNFNNNITWKTSCAEPIIIHVKKDHY